MRLQRSLLLFVFLIVFFYACFEEATYVSTSIPMTIDQTYVLPIFQPLEKTSLSQAKGGIRITITPVDYTVDKMKIIEEEEAEPPLISIRPKYATKYVKVTEYYKLIYSPENVLFKLTINNTLSRVFRGSGSVVQLNWCNKIIDTKYDELSNLILPPGGIAEINIFGPPVSDWLNIRCLNNNIIGIYIYDVITQIDQAGNIKEKQNFEWYFKVDYVNKTAALPKPTYSYKWK